MAKRGSTKALSVEHENYIAGLYDGKRSPSSGAADNDQGDVRVRGAHTLFECKYKGSPATPLKQTPTLLKQMEKIADEAYSESRDPALALRFFAPDSPLANVDGWVDLTVRLLHDDADRNFAIMSCPEDGRR